MIKVTDVLKEIIERDQVAFEAMQQNMLNFSSYAQKIKPKIEDKAFKSVKKGTIVVALSRLAKQYTKSSPINKPVFLKSIEVKSSLSLVRFNRTHDVERKVATLHPFLLPTSEIFSITQGQSQIAIVFSKKSQDLITSHFLTQPLELINDVVSITVGINGTVDQASYIYTLLSYLAIKRIPIIEVVSTKQEFSFIIPMEYVDKTFQTLNQFVLKNQKVENYAEF